MADAVGGAVVVIPAWQQVMAFLLLGAGSWVLRSSFLVLPLGPSVARRLEGWLSLARPAVMAALLASVLVGLASKGGGDVAAWAPLVIGVVLAVVGGWRWGLLGALVLGVTGYWLSGGLMAGM